MCVAKLCRSQWGLIASGAPARAANFFNSSQIRSRRSGPPREESSSHAGGDGRADGDGWTIGRFGRAGDHLTVRVEHRRPALLGVGDGRDAHKRLGRNRTGGEGVHALIGIPADKGLRRRVGLMWQNVGSGRA